MRGKDRYDGNAVQDDRITPAYAGKRILCHCSCHSLQDHPRLCGEKLFGGWDASIRAGSPPPMRGKGEDSSGSYFGTGITPAYAGKSMYECKERPLCRDHPRLCGEKLFCGGSLSRCAGITPAYAGKRVDFFHIVNLGQDHPRLCGEKSVMPI